MTDHSRSHTPLSFSLKRAIYLSCIRIGRWRIFIHHHRSEQGHPWAGRVVLLLWHHFWALSQKTKSKIKLAALHFCQINQTSKITTLNKLKKFTIFPEIRDNAKKVSSPFSRKQLLLVTKIHLSTMQNCIYFSLFWPSTGRSDWLEKKSD